MMINFSDLVILFVAIYIDIMGSKNCLLPATESVVIYVGKYYMCIHILVRWRFYHFAHDVILGNQIWYVENIDNCV